MAEVKKGIVKWLLDAVNDGSRRAPGDVPVKKPPTKKSPKKPPPKNQQKPPPTSKPKVRQRNDGRWAVVGSPKKTYGSKSAATKAANKATAAAEAAKRAEEAAKLKKHLGKGLGVLTVGGLSTLAATRSDKKDDKNKGQGPTIKRAEALKPAAKTATKKRTAAELELIPKGARPPAVKKPATKKRTAAELELIPKGATKPKPKKVVSSRGRGKSRGSTGGESMGEYLKDLQQRNTKVKTPFGIIDVDSTDEGMAFEEFDQKSGGQVKKRRMGGMVKKGYGKALRGY